MASELEAPAGWKWILLADLSLGNTITYGVVQPGADDPHGVPMIRVNNFTANGLDLNNLARIAPSIEAKYTRTRLRPHDVLITVVGSVGQVAIVPAKATNWNIARAVALIRPADVTLSRWIALCLRSPFSQHSLNVTANTTVQTTVNLKELKQLAIPMPPTRERGEIAATLSALDDRIELLRQTNATLEAIAQTLFKSWFVDFEPVHAKAEGREPDGLDAATAALFPDSFEDSPLGPIPRGWHAGSLCAVSSNPRKQAKPEQIDPATPYFGLEHLPRKSIALGDHGIAQGLASGKFWFERLDILFGKLRPYFHKVGLAPSCGICSTDILVLRPSRAAFHGFLLMHASSEALIDYATRLSNGAKMPRSSWKDISSYPVPIPPDPLGDAFNGYVEPLFERILTNIETSRTLSTLRDTLLPRLISGKLRLPEARTLIEEATP